MVKRYAKLEVTFMFKLQNWRFKKIFGKIRQGKCFTFNLSLA